jgi:putative addiction module component (TIGR02574 family)
LLKVADPELPVASSIDDIAAEALQLTPRQRGDLIRKLIASLEGEAADSPEAVARAWDEEIARRVADMESGRIAWIPVEEVFQELDEFLAARIR